MIFLLHIVLSFSLYFIGEYTTLISLQLISMVIFFKSKQLFTLFYIPIIFFSFTKLFASSIYVVYVINLFLFVISLYKYNFILDLKKVFLLAIYLFISYAFFISFEEQLYEIYLDLNITDKVNSISVEVIYFLNILHLIILYLIGIIKKKNRNY